MKETDVSDKYDDVFSGLGKLPGEYHINMNKSASPIQNSPRRVPIPVKEELKEKISELEKSGISAKVFTPTPWISNIVVVKKTNKIRICFDPINLNKGINRNHYPTPVIEEIAPELKNAKVFSVVDARDGFLQVSLDEESSFLTTFWTPFGRYRWTRMPFGLKSSPEEFQRRLDDGPEGLTNIAIIADDMIVYGTGDTEKEAILSHDAALIALLDRCREINLKLNRKKLKLKLKSIGYMGHILSQRGLSPDPDKIKALTDMPKPTDVQGIQRLIGMVTYLAKFLPQLSTVCEPLRRLTYKDAKFVWTEIHDDAFAKMKRLLTEAPVLAFYDAKKTVIIECDSSSVGLGAVITQECRVIAFASCALTATERNYAQIEKECLAIVFATEHFDQYIIGKEKVKVLSDHKPLMTIFKKPIVTCPKRLQRMRLRLQKNDLSVEYKPGPQMFISDTLSRASLPITSYDQKDTSHYHVFRFEKDISEEIEQIDLENDLFVTDYMLENIRAAASTDQPLHTLMNIILEGWPHDKTSLPICIREYWPYRDELTSQNSLAFRGTRIIIPQSMRRDMIVRAHASHLGIQYTNNTAKEVMYWPLMSSELEDAVKKCDICQENQIAMTKDPLMTHPILKLPWQFVASDCFEISGKHYVVVVDMYSDYI